MLTLLDAAKKAAIPANYVLFDSWFSSSSTLHAVKRMDFDAALKGKFILQFDIFLTSFYYELIYLSELCIITSM